jgi:hypothetical protein
MFPAEYEAMKAECQVENAGAYHFHNTALALEWKFFTSYKPLWDSFEKLRDPLKIWLQLKLMMPRLFCVARGVLAISATSTPVERMWNKTKRVFAKLRGRLHPDTGAKQVYVRDVWDFLAAGGENVLAKYEKRFKA